MPPPIPTTEPCPPCAAGANVPILSYASRPVTPPQIIATSGIWADGKTLVIVPGPPSKAAYSMVTLPSRCFRCGERTYIAAEEKLSWSPPEKTLFGTRRVTMRFYLCESDVARISADSRLASGLVFGGLIVAIPGALLTSLLTVLLIGPDKGGIVALAAFVLGIVSFVTGATLASLGKLTAVRIDDQSMRVKGCGKGFLETLPSFDEALRTNFKASAESAEWEIVPESGDRLSINSQT